jgi:hypothetical protein
VCETWQISFIFRCHQMFIHFQRWKFFSNDDFDITSFFSFFQNSGCYQLLITSLQKQRLLSVTNYFITKTAAITSY